MSNFDLTISPSQIEFVSKPGITIIQAYDITNNSDSSITLNTEILPWIPTGTNGSVNYNQAAANPNIEFSLNNSDLKLGQTFVLPANSKKQLVLKIKTNSNMPLSDNYYSFFVTQNETLINSQNNNSQATGKIGSHILLTVSDTANPKVESVIQNFSTTPKIKDVFFGPIQFSGQIKNNSDFFFHTAGKITITKNGQTIKELNLDSNDVLNHHARDVSCNNGSVCQINPPFWPGFYKISVTLDPDLNASAYDTGFYVFPLSPLLLIALIVGLIFGVRKIKKPSPKV